MSKSSPPKPLFGNERDLSSDLIVIPSELQAHPLRQADYQHSLLFLKEYTGSKDTFTAYRREIERFLSWCWIIRQSDLSQLDRETIHHYMAFCQSPPKTWIGTHVCSRFKNKNGERRHNKDWRPFIAKAGSFSLSNNSKQALLSILSSYFNFMIEQGHIAFNPVALIRQKSRYTQKQTDTPIIRRLSNEHWDLLLEEVQEDINNKVKEAERAYFIIASFYLMGLRISELSAGKETTKTMGDFQRDHNKQWWFVTIGKGNKIRHIPVNSDMLTVLGDYRESRQLRRLPIAGEATPLLENFRSGKAKGLSTRMIRYIVVHYFKKTITTLKRKGASEDANHLSAATVHWLRHTSVSEQVKVRDKHHVQQDVGHEDSKTTDNYIDSFDKERHQSMESFKLKPGN